MARPMTMLAAVALLALGLCAHAQAPEPDYTTTKSGMVIEMLEQMNIAFQLSPDAELCVGASSGAGLAGDAPGPKLISSIPCTGQDSDINLFDLDKIVVKEGVTVYWQIRPAGDSANCLTASPPKVGVSSLSIATCTANNLAQQFGIYNNTKVAGAFTIRVRPGGIAKTAADQCINFGDGLGTLPMAGGACKEPVDLGAGTAGKKKKKGGHGSSSRVYFHSDLTKLDGSTIRLRAVFNPAVCTTAPTAPALTPVTFDTTGGAGAEVNLCNNNIGPPNLEAFQLVRSSGKRYYQIVNNARCIGNVGGALSVVVCNANDQTQEFGFYRSRSKAPTPYAGSFQVRVRRNKQCVSVLGINVGVTGCAKPGATNQAWFLN